MQWKQGINNNHKMSQHHSWMHDELYWTPQIFWARRRFYILHISRLELEQYGRLHRNWIVSKWQEISLLRPSEEPNLQYEALAVLRRPNLWRERKILPWFPCKKIEEPCGFLSRCSLAAVCPTPFPSFPHEFPLLGSDRCRATCGWCACWWPSSLWRLEALRTTQSRPWRKWRKWAWDSRHDKHVNMRDKNWYNDMKS